MEINELKNIIIHPEVSVNKIINLLSQLTNMKDNNNKLISKDEYFNFFKYIPENIHIYAMCKENQLIGIGTLMIEPKLTHGGSFVGHIEDIVIDNKFRGNGYGKYLIDFLISKSKSFNCYKVLLNCNIKNKGFYEKCGFASKNIEMSL